MFEEADLIHRYTRAQAIEDGVLIDVSAVAREAGIRYPVALTRAVWQRCVAVPHGVLFQDEAGRLWDVLSRGLPLGHCAGRDSRSGSELPPFTPCTAARMVVGHPTVGYALTDSQSGREFHPHGHRVVQG